MGGIVAEEFDLQFGEWIAIRFSLQSFVQGLMHFDMGVDGMHSARLVRMLDVLTVLGEQIRMYYSQKDWLGEKKGNASFSYIC